MKINGRVRLSDLRSISQQEFDTACHICKKIKEIIELRAFYIKEHGLDPKIVLPAANWTEGPHNDFYDAYRLVATPKYDVINRLRFYTYTFTGYPLMSFSPAYGKYSVDLVPDNFDEIVKKLALMPADWIHKYITITRYLPMEIIARPPKILGEIGWSVDGNPVNYDTYRYQECLNLLYEAGIIDQLRKKIETNGSVNILEIGAGYGGLAYYLKNIIPQTNYYICDIPEALLFALLYLAIARPEYRHTIYDGTDKPIYESDFGFKFIPNFMFDDLVTANMKIDLAINTSSFSEMSEKQVRYYAQNLSYMLGDTGILFEQNLDRRPVDRKPDCFIYYKLYLSEHFMFRKTVGSKSVPELTHGVVTVWANKRICDLLRPRISGWILLVKCLGSRRWLLYKIRHIIRRIVGGERCATFKEFVEYRPRLKSFIFRILGLTGR